MNLPNKLGTWEEYRESVMDILSFTVEDWLFFIVSDEDELQYWIDSYNKEICPAMAMGERTPTLDYRIYQMSKTLQNYIDKHPEKFESWHTEDNNERSCDYWVYCKEPYFSPDSETQTIHEDTVMETLIRMRCVQKGVYNGYSWE